MYNVLEITLHALSIGSEDEVLVSAISWIAVSETELVFVDVLEGCATMDLANAAVKIGVRTKVIIPGHLYGNLAKLDHTQLSMSLGY